MFGHTVFALRFTVGSDISVISPYMSLKRVNPFTTKKFFLSDSAENLTVNSLDYSKIFLFKILSRTVKKLSRKMSFSFLNISDSAQYEYF